jgi:long-chain acyl-CoA synthetase
LREALFDLGVRRADRVAILSYNRPEWIIADLAIQGLGAVDVPIYHTLPATQVDYYLRDSGACVLLTEDARQTAKVGPTGTRSPALRHVVQMDGDPAGDALAYGALVAASSPRRDRSDELDAVERAVSPDDVATFIYTSGTTGAPKGAMLSHRALLHTALAARELVSLTERDVFLSFLPLCHVVERVGGYYLPVTVGAEIVLSGGPFALAADLREARPTAFICVPRVYDSMRERVMEAVATMPAHRRRLVTWALGRAREAVLARQAGRRPPWTGAPARVLADRLVLRRMREAVTGGAMRYVVSGGAPLNPETGIFVESLGIPILEGYGLTELPVISLNRPEDARFGTVGSPLAGIEVRVAPDGEILARGPSLMTGYHGRPDDSASAVDQDGWLHTGDVGRQDPRGRITITDRIKDIIVLANGKNIAPQMIEALMRESPLVQECVLFGDRQNSLGALIVPALDRVRAALREADLPEIEHDLALCEAPAVIRMVKSELDRLSSGLADFERIKQFRLIARPFSIETGELTPTMKVRRRAVAAAYADYVAAMFPHDRES